MSEIVFELNGEQTKLAVSPTRRVIDVLREDLKLTGSKEGCGTGECGACSVLVDGQLRLACLMVAGQLDGHRLTTVEGLGESPLGAKVQTAFAQAGAVQCGYCTPGMEIAAVDLLSRQPDPSRDEVRAALSGNLCRCTGYVKIIDAVCQAADVLNASEDAQS
ncbi:MAG: putative Carbon-monoxide dehydrogenase (acceptor) [Proteobacteria bacterium]|nr:putative Carbon-monoxide dehydrogenase (acceptor) [Pseudomonadota bacterium]